MSEFENFLSNVQALLEADRSAAETRTTEAASAQTQSQQAQTAVADLRPDDAIDVELARPARNTAVVSLKDAPEIEAFRNELIDGLIRVDTANQLLRLLNAVISRMLV